MADLNDLRRICDRLPGAEMSGDSEVGIGYGVTVKGKEKGFVWTWKERGIPKQPKRPNLAVVAISTPGLAAKEALMASNPPWYVEDPHYHNYPAILVRLADIETDELEDLLTEAWSSKTGRPVPD